MRVGRPGIPQYKGLFRSVDLTKTDQLEYVAPEIPIIVSIKIKDRVGHVTGFYSLQHGYQFQDNVVLIPL